MAKQHQVLILEPSSELTFKGPFTEYVNANLTLSNPSPKDVFFKVKTTAPKFYCVRPNSGVIKAKDKTQINVMLQPVESPEVLENERNRHKFMIQSAFVPEGEQQPLDMFWKSVDPAQIMDSKLRVIFHRPYGLVDEAGKDHDNTTDVSGSAKGYSTVYNSSPQQMAKESPSPTSGQMAADPQVALQKERELRKMYQDEKANLEKENNALLEKMEILSRASNSGTITQEAVPMLQAILFAVMALIIGLIVGKLI